MTAATHDLTIEAGSTFKLNVTWQDSSGAPIDLTGYRVRAEFLEGGTDAVVLDADTAHAVEGITLTTPDTTGNVLITVAYALTEVLEGTGRYVVDVTSPGGEATRLLQGAFVVSPGAPSDD